ncbi:MAG: tetratricopeptide repeat protein [Acidobacteriia bacterium]|nr:tetratricopeptide repeat protein [Terriglobia bacterium]
MEGAEGRPARGWLRRHAIGAAAVSAAVLATAGWLGAGVRRIDPAFEFGVVESRFLGAPRKVSGPTVVVPPGLYRFQRFPRNLVEVPLPSADAARLEAPDGTLFGLVGRAAVVIRDDGWLAAAKAAGGAGLQGVLSDALRATVRALGPWDVREPIPQSVQSRFEAEFGRALGLRGVDLRRLTLGGAVLLTVPKGASLPAASETKLLVLGLDGADWAILDPLLRQGKMPNLARLIERGIRSKFLTISPALSPVVWTSIATGVNPATHGVLDFLVPDPAGGEGQPVTSAQRRVPSIWDFLSGAGVEVGVVGWWATWPAGPLDGFMVTDRVAYQLFGLDPDPGRAAGKTWPADLYDAEVRRRIVKPSEIGWETVLAYLDGPRRRPEEFDADETKLLDDFRTLLASTETYLRVTLALRSKYAPRFESVYFEGTDTVGHLFMSYRPPKLAGVEPKRFESFHAVVDRYYEAMDRDIGLLLEGREKGWTIMVLSDHGFASDASRPLTTDSRIGHGPAADWHRRFGVLVLAGEHIRAGTRLGETGIYDIAPTVLALFGQPVPRPWPGAVLSDAIDPAFLKAHPVRYREDAPAFAMAAGGGEASPSDPEAAELREKLRSLGYLGSTEDKPVRVTTRNNTGIALLAQGKRSEAEKEFRAALKDQPDQPVILVNLGTLLRFEHRTDEARKTLERALAFTATRRAAGQQLGQLFLDLGDLDDAEKRLRQVLEVEPGAADVVNTLGLVLQKKGKGREASDLFHEATDLDADAAEPRTNLGNLARAAGRLDEAEDWYQKAIEADPYYMGAYNNLALVYQDRGEMKRAIDLYDRALAKSPNHAVVLNNLGSLFYATGDLERARNVWKRSAAADARYPSPLNNLAGLELAAGKLDLAEELLRKALVLDPNYGDARINMALVLRHRGNNSAARRQLEKALSDPKSRATALLQLGVLDLGAGDNPSALARLDEARRLSTGRDTLLLNAYGEAARRMGRGRDAIQAFKASLAVDPSQKEIRAVVDKLESRTGAPPR